MIDAKNWDEFLKTVTYKDGWTLEHDYCIDEDTDYLIVRMQVEDTYNPSNIIPVFTKRPLPRFNVVADSYHEWIVREAIHFMECHEADENLRFNGVMVFDPHKIDLANV